MVPGNGPNLADRELKIREERNVDLAYILELINVMISIIVTIRRSRYLKIFYQF